MNGISIKSITLLLLASAFAATGCNNTFEMDLPLAVNSRALDLEETSGSTHILVYADGAWTAKFTEPVEWASLDRVSGSGNSELVLSYAANYGISRRLKIALAKGEYADTIAINQKGSLTEPELTWGCDSLSFNKTSGKASIAVSTNLYYSLQNVSSEITWLTEGTDWISDVDFDGKKVKFAVSENNSGKIRRANLDFKVAVPGNSETDDDDKLFRVLVSQDSEDAKLELQETDFLNGMKGSASIDVEGNNVWTYDDAVSYSVEYDPAVGERDEWITGLSLSEKKLSFKIADNMSGDFRKATIKVLFNGKTVAEKTVTQDVYPVVIGFDQLRGYAVGTLSTREFIEGYVVSEHGSENVCQNPQTAQFKFDMTENSKTAVIESVDGKYGFMLKFATAEDNTLQRYSKVRIKLRDLTLSKQADPECYTLSGLTAESIVSATDPNSRAVPVKKMSVADLKDSDIYTLVALQNMEVVFKDGSYTNCNEGYALKTSFNPAGGGSPRWDVAPLLLTDNSGNTISMLTNSNVEWRRDGSGVAQGSGTYTGIIVAETLVRFGDRGRYQIRPMVKSDIALDNAAFSKTLVEWNWNDAKNDAVPEVGSGSISGVTLALAQDYNALIPNNVGGSRTEPTTGTGNKGAVNSQAAYFNSTWKVGSTFDISFSTAGISGTNLQFGFVWGHGKANNTTINVPSHWRLLYSTDDGATFTEFVPMVKTRSIVWWSNTPVDVAPGYTDHMFKLPQDCFGKDKVIVRFQVVDNVCDKDPKATSATWKTALSVEQGTFTTSNNPLRFGAITVRYN